MYANCCSPAYSRPTSPQSDSEVLCFNQDATAQTHLTGDRLILLDDVKWKWGEIPETTPHSQTVRCMSSKLSQTPVSMSSTLTNRFADTQVDAVSHPVSQPSAFAAVERASDQVSVMSNSELADFESEKGLTESKLLVENDVIETSTATQAACSSDATVDIQITEPLPEETKKGGFST